MKHTKSALALALSSLLLATTACAPSPTASTSQEIRIGGLAPLTGPVSVYGEATNNGIQLALKEINAAGGINGKPIVLTTYDEKGDSQEAINAYNRLREAGIVALLGDVTSKPSIAVAQRAQEDQMPTIAPTPTATAITEAGDYIFRASFIDPDQGRMMAQLLKNREKLNRVAVLYNQSDDYSVGLAEAFADTAKTIGLEIVAMETYANEDSDFANQLVNISKAKPEALYITDYYQKNMQILLQARKLGLNLPLYGGDGWDGIHTVVSKDNPQEADGVIFSTQFTALDPSDKVQSFVQAYRQAYQADPISFAALGYDAMYLLAEALKKAPNLEGAAIRDAIAQTDYQGVTGRFRFDQTGDPLKEMTFVQVKDGAYQLLDKIQIER